MLAQRHPPEGIVDADRLFAECLTELESRATWEASEFALLRASGLLRILLLDEVPLVIEVNRSRRIKLAFRARHSPQRGPQDVALWLGGLDPEHPSDDGLVEDLSLKNLLQIPVVFLGPDRITVRDMITLAANAGRVPAVLEKR
jgi:hypothetical protein